MESLMYRCLVIPLVFSLALVSGCSRQEEETTSVPANDAPAGQPASAVTPSAPETPAATTPPAKAAAPETPTNIATPDQMMQAMVKAYRDAPVLIDRITVEQGYANKPLDPGEILVILGPGMDTVIDSPKACLTSINGKLYYELDRFVDRYVVTDLVDDPFKTCESELKIIPVMATHWIARYGKSPAELVSSMTFGMPGILEFTNSRQIVDPQGRTLDQVTISSANGLATFNMDPTTHFLISAHIEYVPRGAPVRNLRMYYDISYNPQVYDALPDPLSFDPDERRAFESISAMFGQADEELVSKLRIKEGRPAPAFKAITLFGQDIDVAEEWADQIVVFYFWSNRSVDAVSLLSSVVNLALEAEASGDFKVWPVAALMEGQDEGERHTRAYGHWEERKYKGESLFDRDDSIARRWGVEIVPIAVIVKPGGEVHTILSGKQDNFIELIRNAVVEAQAGG